MAWSLAVIVDGSEYSLSDGPYGWRLEDDGTGMAPVHRLTERGPLQHGETDIGYRLDPRLIRLVLGIEGADRHQRDVMRRNLLRLFKPDDNPVTLKWTLDNGDVRQIDCFYQGDMAAPSTERLGETQRLALSLVAPDPTFYAAAQVVDSFSPIVSADGLVVPMSVPTGVGTSTANSTYNLSYAGDVRSYPVVRISGPIWDPILYNTTTGERLDFTGAMLGDGGFLEIDCRYGYKTVVDQDGNSQLASLGTDSDLATFHLEPPVGLAASKTNVFVLTGSYASEATAVTITYYPRYIGL